MSCNSCHKNPCCCPEKRVTVKGKRGDRGDRGPAGPPGPVTNTIVSISNTVFVDKGGNDLTGLAERLDRPFLTLNAARTAAVALSPSSTKRVLVKVFSGDYTDETIILANYVDWDLGNSRIPVSAPSINIIYDNGIACNSIIYGEADIENTGGGKAILTENSSTILTVKAKRIFSSDTAITCVDGTQKIYCSDISGVISAETYDGNQIIYGDLTGKVYCRFGTQNIYGNIFNNGDSCAQCDVGGTLNITGTSIKSINLPGGDTIINNGGNTNVNNSRIVNTGLNGNCVQKIGGSGGLLLKDCVLVANGTGYSVRSNVPSNVNVYGRCVANVAVDSNTTLLVGTVANYGFVVSASVV